MQIDDGEAGEATLLQLRAKLFALESKEVGWKERGVGTLKINVPKPCVSYDENGVPIPGSFDASGLEDEDVDSTGPRVARLIMRQENTHRVVLNTIIVRAMEFKDKPSTTTAQIIFTAFEGDKEPKPVNMLLKASCSSCRISAPANNRRCLKQTQDSSEQNLSLFNESCETMLYVEDGLLIVNRLATQLIFDFFCSRDTPLCEIFPWEWAGRNLYSYWTSF